MVLSLECDNNYIAVFDVFYYYTDNSLLALSYGYLSYGNWTIVLLQETDICPV